jgi:hypothetical protein
MALAELIARDDAGVGEIGRYLDGLDGDARWREVGRLTRPQQRMLYEKAASAPPITLEHFASGKALDEVIHDGLNTLPVPAPFRRFQKRFCRTRAGDARLFGYNHGPTTRTVGPGYFVTVATRGRPHWEARGPIVIDYFQVPDAEVPPSWPRVVPNQKGLQRFVYRGTRDFMRKVSAHVSIGAAFKGERPLDHYFVLCRR